MEAIMYTFDSRIRYSECDREGRLTLEALLNYFQDASTFHSEDLGVGTDYLKKEHRAWVINNWQIVFAQTPKLGDHVVIGTFPYEMRGFLGSRNFVMDSPDGKRYAYANTLWTYMDTDRMLPVRVPEYLQQIYVNEPRLDMDYAPRKLAMPSDLLEGETILVRPYHLDTNQHVNNGQYIRMAMGHLPQGKRVRELRAEFKKAALLGDTIVTSFAVNPDCVYVSLNDTEGQPYALVQLYLVEENEG